MKNSLKKKFGKYTVTLEVWTESNPRCDNRCCDESRSECFISHVTRAGREYTASLACASDTGELSNALYGEIAIDPAIVDDIEAWAVEHGY